MQSTENNDNNNDNNKNNDNNNDLFGIFSGLAELLPEELKTMDIYDDFYSRIYDFITGTVSYDLGIYLEAVAGEEKKEILEFACGSGRLLFPLVQGGHSVTGVDLSRHMLALLEKKMQYQSPEIRNAVAYKQGDMTTLKLDQTFDVIILGACSFCLLQTTEERSAFFDNVRRHLKPGGIFMFDYQVFDYETIARKDEHINFFTINAGYPKHFMFMGEKIFAKEKYALVNFYNEMIEQDGKTLRYLGKTRKAMVDGSEVDRLLKQNGLECFHTTVSKVDETFIKEIKHLYCRPANEYDSE